MGFNDAEFNGCNSKSGGVPRLGFPGYYLNNAENGVGGAEGVNAYPVALPIGASRNRELAYARGAHLGREFRRKGVNVALGPSLGPRGRSLKGGRSNDPYLTGVLISDTTAGMQKYVIADIKHIVGNEQETSRNVMCSYNRVNNSDSCQNKFGFHGLVVSDWFMQQNGVASALVGLGMVMPIAPYWTDGNLTKMVNNGSESIMRLDDMATCILAPWYKIGSHAQGVRRPGYGILASLTNEHEFIDARSPDTKPIMF
ncbi:glycoside hydrolase [Setomelanomma holmii]|uniref:beta-glucosidase n=1 Tax=Setomelanomma holmii TaxID=210430 RepID=A0A9P4GV77_9PLEO|nr:glycoside hydrolase [Setomelanomma holmii]